MTSSGHWTMSYQSSGPVSLQKVQIHGEIVAFGIPMSIEPTGKRNAIIVSIPPDFRNMMMTVRANEKHDQGIEFGVDNILRVFPDKLPPPFRAPVPGKEIVEGDRSRQNVRFRPVFGIHVVMSLYIVTFLEDGNVTRELAAGPVADQLHQFEYLIAVEVGIE